MIDVNCESLLTLTQAAKRLPSRRPGKSPHVATLYRWASRGVRGVVLDTVRIGGTRFTSVEAVGRFSRALTEGSAVPRRSEGGGATRRLEAAEDVLERHGV